MTCSTISSSLDGVGGLETGKLGSSEISSCVGSGARIGDKGIEDMGYLLCKRRCFRNGARMGCSTHNQ